MTSTFDIDAIRAGIFTVMLVLSASCQVADDSPNASRQYRSTDTTVSSRGVQVPVTFVEPIVTNEKLPLVVMAHGHGGTRHEEGSFRKIAEHLAARGIASIRMDFPGCGDSTETFANNNLGNMMADFLAARDYAISQPNIDDDRVGLFGWSMGGRLVLLLGARNDDFRVIASWSPAATNGADSMVSFLGGPLEYDQLRARAEKLGSVPFTTRWGQRQELGLQWFDDLENSQPLDSIGEFSGPLLVLYGDHDDVVIPEVSEATIRAATSSVEVVRHVVRGADHGLGIFSGEDSLTEEAVNVTVDFLSERL